MKTFYRLLAVFSVLAFGASQRSHGGLVIDIVESGSDVVATLSGSISDLYGTTLQSSGSYTNSNRIGGSPSRFQFSNNPGGSQVYDVYSVGSNPSNFSGLGIRAASSSTASASMIFFASDPALYIAQDYVLGTEVTGQLTWNSTTVGGLGLSNGFYMWDWSGDSITLNINGTAPSPVPEPGQMAASLFLLVIVGGVLLARRRRTPGSAKIAA